MNKLRGNIINILSSGNISLVEVDLSGVVMSSMIIGNTGNTPFLKLGSPVFMLFKESEVSIAKGFKGAISVRNQLLCTIKKIETGDVFTCITMDFVGEKLNSLITTRSAERLELSVGDEVTGLIKSNEVILSEYDE